MSKFNNVEKLKKYVETIVEVHNLLNVIEVRGKNNVIYLANSMISLENLSEEMQKDIKSQVSGWQETPKR